MTRKEVALGLALLLAVTGCAPTLEQFRQEQAARRAAQTPALSPLQPVWAQAACSDLVVEARWQGTDQPLVTGQDWLGRVSRFVVPYTRDTWLVSLRITNRGQTPVVVRAADWQLIVQPGAVRRNPLPLQYFKGRWPPEAVLSETMMLDQALAIGHVIRTIWEERTIPPGGQETGTLAFAVAGEVPRQVTVEWSGGNGTVRLSWGGTP